MTRFVDRRRYRIPQLGVKLCALLSCGCSMQNEVPVDALTNAWVAPRQTSTVGVEWPARMSALPSMSAAVRSPPEVIATVNGRSISRQRLDKLLMRSRGLEVLEQLIGLETANMAADARGLTVTQDDVDREYDRALRRLVDPLSSITPDSFDRGRAEELLRTVLTERKVSHEEFLLVMKRNACLRKIVSSETTFTTDQLRREFDRLHGNRALVRHIQLASLNEVDRVNTAMASGTEFGELARRFSANTASAEQGGLLEPFSAEDDALPRVFRDVAFSLAPDAVSSPVRVGEWYHLIKLERIVPPEDVQFKQERNDLERRLRNRDSDRAMFEVFENLFQEASIEIYDPGLRAAFDRKRSEPDR